MTSIVDTSVKHAYSSMAGAPAISASIKTGSTRNRPSMRSAKISASAPLERRSCAVMVVEDLSAPGVPALGDVLIFFTLEFCQESKSYAHVN